jgi:hypothetical protein
MIKKTLSELLKENYILENEVKEIKVDNDFLEKQNEKIIGEVLELRENNTKLIKSIKSLHNKNMILKDKLLTKTYENGDLKEEIKELKNQISYSDECMQILVEENNKLCALETFSSQMNHKEQRELEQATLLVDNLLEQLAQAEKEILLLSNDKKKLQLLNERMNNCITLQSQEIFKLLK